MKKRHGKLHLGKAARHMKPVRAVPKGQDIGIEDLELYTIPESGMQPRVAYDIIHEQMFLNFSPALNLATFVNTWMDEEAKKLALESINVNLIDRAEYPMTTEIQKRNTWMIAKLLNAEIPDEIKDDDFIGTGTVGSSDAVMLGIIAHLTNWRNSGYGDKHKQPNIVIGGAYQICWEKIFKFFNVQPRIIPIKDGTKNIVTKEDIQWCYDEGWIDDNTCAIGLICGTTFTGQTDEIEAINQLVHDHNNLRQPKGPDNKVFRVPIHVDAASGGFILPFALPDFLWDFRLSEIQSINLSNHKYGLVYPGMGTVIFRDVRVVPPGLFTDVDYLGGTVHDYALSFSRGSFHVICQYYNFLRLGIQGYKRVMDDLIKTSSEIVSELLENYGKYFELQSDLRPAEGEHGMKKLLFPVIVFRVKDNNKFNADMLSARLRQDGWYIPAYPYPHPENEFPYPPDKKKEKRQEKSVLIRMVIREGFSEYMAELLIKTIAQAIEEFEKEETKPKEILRPGGSGHLC
ncbi:MAG: glutamate decarboxylase [Candidatus Aminicenantes bacterium]|nr:MAG: glutamate decarboxylase [Candidatus Aminicenantes bacterium]